MGETSFAVDGVKFHHIQSSTSFSISTIFGRVMFGPLQRLSQHYSHKDVESIENEKRCVSVKVTITVAPAKTCRNWATVSHFVTLHLFILIGLSVNHLTY